MQPFDCVRFEPTYEELKQNLKKGKSGKWSSFEPTYEELKLQIQPMILMMKLGFEPTYEELKPAFLQWGE